MKLGLKSVFVTLFVGISLLVLTPGRVFSYTYGRYLDDTDARNYQKTLRENPSFDLNRTYSFPGKGQLLRFLFTHLKTTSTMFRTWNILDLRVKKNGPHSYTSKMGESLEGPFVSLKQEDNYFVYVGKGTYRQSYVPFAIQGRALINLYWEEVNENNKLKITTRLRVKPRNTILDLIGYVLYPVVNKALNNAIDRIITLGRELVSTIQQYPNKTYVKLEKVNRRQAETWRKYLRKNHPDKLKNSMSKN